MNEDAITLLLRDAAARIPVTSQLDAVLADAMTVPMTTDVDRGRRRMWPVAIAAAVLAVAALGVGFASRGDEPARVASGPTPVPAGPVAGSVAAYVVSPPAWVGDLFPAWRTGGERTGRWVRAAYGIVDGDRVVAPFTVSAYDGTIAIGATRTIEVDGVEYREAKTATWRVLFTTDEPTVMLSGPSDVDLVAVARAARAVDVDGRLTLQLGPPPDGYELLVPPQTLAADATHRPSLAGALGTLSVHEISDVVHPLLAAASSGTDLRRVEVNGRPGWFGVNTVREEGPIAFLDWSPEPGVVFELVTVDPSRSLEDLLELASLVEVVPTDGWEARLGR